MTDRYQEVRVVPARDDDVDDALYGTPTAQPGGSDRDTQRGPVWVFWFLLLPLTVALLAGFYVFGWVWPGW